MQVPRLRQDINNIKNYLQIIRILHKKTQMNVSAYNYKRQGFFAIKK